MQQSPFSFDAIAACRSNALRALEAVRGACDRNDSENIIADGGATANKPVGVILP